MTFDIENPLVFGLHGMGEHQAGWSKGGFGLIAEDLFGKVVKVIVQPQSQADERKVEPQQLPA